jgi:hypothetical protein
LTEKEKGVSQKKISHKEGGAQRRVARIVVSENGKKDATPHVPQWSPS